MHTIRTGVEIDAPVEAVGAVLGDLERYPERNPVVRRVDGRLAVGSVVTFHVGRDLERIDCRVVRVEEEGGFSWRFHERHPLLYRGEHSFRLEALDGGRTQLADQEPSPASSSRSAGARSTPGSTPA